MPLADYVRHFTLYVEGNERDQLSYVHHSFSHNKNDFLSRVHAGPWKPVQVDVVRAAR